jgi:hypothetical protein
MQWRKAMIYHEIKIEDSDYKYLEKSARIAGLSIEEYLRQIIQHQQTFKKTLTNPQSARTKKSRWAKLSEKIRKNPPLRGAGDYVSKMSKDFRNEFSFRHDED